MTSTECEIPGFPARVGVTFRGRDRGEVRRRRVGLSPTEARPGEAPKYIRVDTEARTEFCVTTSGAPTEVGNRHAIATELGKTDARNDE